MHNNGEGLPCPRESCTNGCGQPMVSTAPQRKGSGAECSAEEELKQMEPMVVKKANREILDHERKRRVELKCMELQEMMEEQGYTHEEIRQKVGTFRQMLMEKEGVLTKENPQEHHVCESSSSSRKERKKKSGKKHKRDRSDSGSRKKRRHRSTSPKSKRKDRSKQRRRSPSESPPRKPHKARSCCSSRSVSASSIHSSSKSLSSSHSPSSEPRASHFRAKRSAMPRQPKSDTNERKPCCARCSPSQSPLQGRRNRSMTPRENGHKGPSWSDRHSPRHRHPPNRSQDSTDSRSLSPGVESRSSSKSPKGKEGKHSKHDPRSFRSKSPGRSRRSSTEGRRAKLRSRSASAPRGSGRRKSTLPARRASSRSPSQSDVSSDSTESVNNRSRLRHPSGRSKSIRAKRLRQVSSHHHQRRYTSRNKSHCWSPGKHEQPSSHNADKKKSSSYSPRRKSSSRSSSRSLSRSCSRSHDKRDGRSKSRSSPRKEQSRERDSDVGARHHDSEAERHRRRSRSYSPIRKRRRDSPSFMEPRRITSARKRPIPYYRPSPSSPSSLSSYSSYSRSRSRSYDSYSSYSRSRTRSRSRSQTRSRSRSRSRSRTASYDSRTSSESTGF
ncbi:serine/arginine repetitive matrix protein 3 isoform X2 [Narcine bancroftii]|uniref:serine/arginine repetitive matrix protein 3 isoform X2 n=1 Tax=Narcine bancroftii TaxID=1343680 RepID=UPI0038321F61